MKRALYLFALTVGVIGLAIAVVLAWNAPPLEEHLGGMVYEWHGAERREIFLKAWAVAFGAVGSALLFGALGVILDRLEALRK